MGQVGNHANVEYFVCGTKHNHRGMRCVDVKLFTVGFDIGFCGEGSEPSEVYFIAAYY